MNAKIVFCLALVTLAIQPMTYAMGFGGYGNATEFTLHVNADGHETRAALLKASPALNLNAGYTYTEPSFSNRPVRNANSLCEFVKLVKQHINSNNLVFTNFKVIYHGDGVVLQKLPVQTGIITMHSPNPEINKTLTTAPGSHYCYVGEEPLRNSLLSEGYFAIPQCQCAQ